MQERHKPETLRLRAITPALTVQDIQASLEYYRDVLGFIVQDTFEDEGKINGALLRAGDVSFVLSQDDFAQGRDRKKGVGLRLWCSTAQDLDQLAHNIESRGGELAGPIQTHSWGARAFAVVDPDGFKISFEQVAAGAG